MNSNFPLIIKEKMFTCIFCSKTFQGVGNTAMPLVVGRCCDSCNIEVIKARMRQKPYEKRPAGCYY